MDNRERIRLALIDMIMPRNNWKEVAEVIRKVSPQTKILFARGYTMDIIMTKEFNHLDRRGLHEFKSNYSECLHMTWPCR